MQDHLGMFFGVPIFACLFNLLFSFIHNSYNKKYNVKKDTSIDKSKKGNIFALALLLFYPIASIAVSVVIGLLTVGTDYSIDKASLVLIVIQDLIIILIPIILTV